MKHCAVEPNFFVDNFVTDVEGAIKFILNDLKDEIRHVSIGNRNIWTEQQLASLVFIDKQQYEDLVYGRYKPIKREIWFTEGTNRSKELVHRRYTVKNCQEFAGKLQKVDFLSKETTSILRCKIPHPSERCLVRTSRKNPVIWLLDRMAEEGETIREIGNR